MAAELQQPGLFPVQLERELLEPRSHRVPEAPRIGFVLEAHDESSAYRTTISCPWLRAVAIAAPTGRRRSAGRRWPAAAMITAPCGVPFSLALQCPSSRTPALSHLRTSRMMRSSPTRCLTKRSSHAWPTASKKPLISASRIQFTGVPLIATPRRPTRHAGSPGPEPVREAEEVFLVDRIEHGDDCTLDDLVFQRGNTQRALSPSGFGMNRRRTGSARYVPRWTRCVQVLKGPSRPAS